MRRRQILAGVGACASWPLVALAQKQTLPLIGFLHSGLAEQNGRRLARFRKGLAAAGLVEGRDIAIDYRWAGGQNARLPELAADLVARGVRVLVTLSSTPAALAAQAATKAIPIVFLIAESPVDLGLAASLSQPGGNATGLVTLNADLAAKRLELLRALTPDAPAFAVLLNPSSPGARPVSDRLRAAADALRLPLQVLAAESDAELDAAFRALMPATPLLVATNPFFFVRRERLAALAAGREVPAIYDGFEYVQAGGLMSYGANVEKLWEQAALVVSRILAGTKPADFPVAQATTFELAINLKAAHALGLTVSPALLAQADEVIE